MRGLDLLQNAAPFKNIIRNQDLTALAANLSDCRGCNLCKEWLVVYGWFFLQMIWLILMFLM